MVLLSELALGVHDPFQRKRLCKLILPRNCSYNGPPTLRQLNDGRPDTAPDAPATNICSPPDTCAR